MKKVILALFLLVALSVYAGQYEDALRTGRPVCLYIYTKACRYCKQTTPVFEKMFENHKKVCNFVKVDANSPYGSLLLRDIGAGYVPFVVFSDAKRQYFVPVAPSCVLEYSCFDKALKDFIKS